MPCFCLIIIRAVSPEINTEKTLFVFVSHVHYDHYNPDILKLRRQRQNIWYLFSDDVPMPDEQKQVIRLSPEEERRVNGIRVRTLPSTDEGVAFWMDLGNRDLSRRRFELVALGRRTKVV